MDKPTLRGIFVKQDNKMELNDELKLLLIKTEPHRDEASASGVFDTIRDLEDIDEASAYEQRLKMFYSKHPTLGTTDSDGRWVEPTQAELKVALIENEYVAPTPTPVWQVQGYENETAWTNDQYARDRKRAYPTIEDQLDKIFHEGIDAWKAEIQAIKDANPKP